MGACPKLGLDVRSPAPVGMSALDNRSRMSLTTLQDTTIEDYLDRGVGGKAFPEVRVEIPVVASDDEEGAPHLLLDVDVVV